MSWEDLFDAQLASGLGYREEKAKRREAAAAAVQECRSRLASAGYTIHRLSEVEYAIRSESRRYGWKIYPGNCRIGSYMRDGWDRPPFLEVPLCWSLTQVVDAVLALEATLQGKEGGEPQ